VNKEADKAQNGIMQIVAEGENRMMPEIRKIIMPRHHDVRKEDVNLKRLGSVLALAEENGTNNFEELLLLQGLGPRTLQSLTLVSEVIHGTPSRFSDPARFSFAHGGKDGHPFPVPTKVYDETIGTLKNAVEKAKIGFTDKQKAIQSLHTMAERLEKDFIPEESAFEKLIDKERTESYKYGGRTVTGWAKPLPKKNGQLDLFG